MCARGTGTELRATGGAQAGPLRPAPPRPRPGCGSVAGGMLSPASRRPILQTPARSHTKLCPAPVLSFPIGILVRPLPQWVTRSSDPQVRAPEVRGQSLPPAPLAAVSGPPWARQPVSTGPGVAQVPRGPES